MLNIEKIADRNELFDGHYALIRPLSVDGATADVWLALDVNTISVDIDVTNIARLSEEEINKLGLLVAIKIYRPQNALDIEGELKFREEYMIVYNCHHTNLIHPTHYSIFKETPYLVLPYCKLGSSELLIGKLNDEDKIWKYVLDVSSGLAYLHALTPPIIHQDIKPANILLDDTMNYAITDFGISSKKGGVYGFGDDYENENTGTMAYMAPERFIQGSEPIPQSDIWAFGATLYELLTGKVPYGEEGGQMQLVNKNLPMPEITGCSPNIQKLIHACLEKEPGNRPSADQLANMAKRYFESGDPFPKPLPFWKKHKLYLIVSISLISIALIVLFFLKWYHPAPELEGIAKAANMMKESKTAKEGLKLLTDMSNQGDADATYLLSRIYFISKEERDYIPDSVRIMQNALNIKTDYDKAHELLLETIRLSPNNYHALFELGCDYMGGDSRTDAVSRDIQKADQYFSKALEYAKMKNDTDYIKRIEAIMEIYKDYLGN